MTDDTRSTPEAGAGARFDAVMAGLKSWRDALVREGKVQLGGLKDTHLQSAVVRGRRDPRMVQQMVPGTYAHLSSEIVNVIMSIDSVSSDPASPSPAAQPTPAPSQPAEPTTPPPSAAALQGTPPSVAGLLGTPPSVAGLQGTPPSAAGPAESRPTARSAEEVADNRQQARQFAALDFTEDIGEPLDLRAVTTDGGFKLSWPAWADASVGTVYRVVSDDGDPGYAPEFSELVDVTRELTTSDDRQFTAAVRYFQVWRNSGSTWDEAVARQPRKHAETAVVASVGEFSLREDGGRVIAQWSVPPGVIRVHVHRIPIELAARTGLDSRFRIAADDTNLSGFIDREAVRGKRYLYRFYAEAEVAVPVPTDGQQKHVSQLSEPLSRTVAVSALLSPVFDLAVLSHATTTDTVFGLSWTDPVAGRVVIYRTQVAPTPGLADEARSESALPSGGLSMDDRLAHPTHVVELGRTGMREVPSPTGWDRVYFTPVTLLDGQARVGTSVSRVVIPAADNLVLVERTEHQVLKFGWPGDAAAVAIGLGPRGAEPSLPEHGPGYLEVSRDAYRRLGGLQFAAPLPSEGCSVHVAGLSFVNRERSYGAAEVVDYPGLLRLAYTLDCKRNLFGKPDRVIIRLSSTRVLSGGQCPPFVLVHHRERLPLHVRDGESLPVVLNVDEVAEPRSQFQPERLGPGSGGSGFKATVKGRVGYLRVFVDVPSSVLRRVAVLDPPCASLVLR